MGSHAATEDGKLKKCRRTIWHHVGEGDVVEAEILRAREDIWIRLDASGDLAQNNTKGEDICSLVVPLASQALGGHPVWRSNHG